MSYICLICLFTAPLATDKPPQGKKHNVTMGVILLTAEYTIGPAIAYANWWAPGFTWDNPFNHIGELEPYLEDNAWHLAGCTMITELHYRILHECFGSKYATTLATSLTFFDFTAVECLDALEKTGRWKFSIGDEVANVLGIGFWLLKHRYPTLPVDVRIGVRKWGAVRDLCREAYTAVANFERFKSENRDHYSILKVEGLYRLGHGFYLGIALSKKDSPSSDNLWGITAGWDIIKGLKGTGHRNSLFETMSEYVSMPISFTLWFDRDSH